MHEQGMAMQAATSKQWSEGGGMTPRSQTLTDRVNDQMQYHTEKLDKLRRLSEMLKAHPEMEEFTNLLAHAL